ncbi:MAG: hypothetical protein CTY15_08660 [Methylocystis sp.]|nr:MAG: hypothetical protein CTY15_08660 [Methylocystis sp.]
MYLSASLSDLVSAVFNGAPTPEATERYTAQLTALISLYICFVGVFMVGLYIRAVNKRQNLDAPRRAFKVWIAWSLMFSILMVAAAVAYFLAAE